MGAIQQAVQRAPNYAESHNIEGLVYEARSDYISAIAAYRRARFVLTMGSHSDSDAVKSHLANVSVNLARSLCKVNAVRTKVLIMIGILAYARYNFVQLEWLLYPKS